MVTSSGKRHRSVSATSTAGPQDEEVRALVNALSDVDDDSFRAFQASLEDAGSLQRLRHTLVDHREAQNAFRRVRGFQNKPCWQVVADQINCAKEPPSTLCGEGPGRRTPVGIVAKRTVPVDIRDATLKSAAGDPGGAGLRSQLLKALDHLAIEPGATNCDDEIRCDFGRTLSQYWRASGTARASP